MSHLSRKLERTHRVTVKLTEAEYVALLKAVQIQCGPRKSGDEIGLPECRRFVRMAIHQVALTAIREGECPYRPHVVLLPDETPQHRAERLYLADHPEKIDSLHFGLSKRVIRALNAIVGGKIYPWHRTFLSRRKEHCS